MNPLPDENDVNHEFFHQHLQLTRRFFLQAGVLGLVSGPFGQATALEIRQETPKQHVKPDN